jgi:GT2 family glycosyltransferase
MGISDIDTSRSWQRANRRRAICIEAENIAVECDQREENALVPRNLPLLEREQTDPNAAMFQLFVVVVLYKLKPSESKTLNTLREAISCLRQGQANIRILLYDNTPGGQDPGMLPANVQYKADFTNSGLAKAYNYALESADREGFDWLLTLDQDTSLPADFLRQLCHTASFVGPLTHVGAIAPYISGDGRVISPFVITKHWIGTTHLQSGFIGVSLQKTHAVNSASTLRVSALKTIGGYDPKFHLAYSDIVLFDRLHNHGFRIFVAGNIRVQHEMSIFDLKNRSSARRYEEMLRAEEAYYDDYMGRIGDIVLVLKLSYRLVFRLWKTGRSLPYFRLSVKFLCRRLFFSRKHRMESWNLSPTLESQKL